MESLILRLVHDTHPTAAELLENAVVRDGLADPRIRVIPRGCTVSVIH